MTSEQKTRNYIRRRTIDLNCQWCGTEFEAKRKDTKYCSPSCRVSASKDRNSESENENPSKMQPSATAFIPPKEGLSGTDRIFEYKELKINLEEITDLSVCKKLIHYFMDQRLQYSYSANPVIRKQVEEMTNILIQIRERRSELKLQRKFAELLTPDDD